MRCRSSESKWRVIQQSLLNIRYCKSLSASCGLYVTGEAFGQLCVGNHRGTPDLPDQHPCLGADFLYLDFRQRPHNIQPITPQLID